MCINNYSNIYNTILRGSKRGFFELSKYHLPSTHVFSTNKSES